jgi:transcription antitermination protein NusB
VTDAQDGPDEVAGDEPDVDGFDNPTRTSGTRANKLQAPERPSPPEVDDEPDPVDDDLDEGDAEPPEEIDPAEAEAARRARIAELDELVALARASSQRERDAGLAAANVPDDEDVEVTVAEVPAAPRRILDVDGPRRDARTRALEMLFAADVRDITATVLLTDGTPIDRFTELLVDTVAEHRFELDQLIGQHARGWTLDRMPAVDRAVLRLGIAEMLYVDDVPPKVAIAEAVEMAKSLSTDGSPAFVNGVLDAIAHARELI